ncbi:MAG: hypothetical protein E7312_03050 [Clostridiales bacterium]|nr:hypothetical protein [Clostridiales bacterium]
MYEEQNIQLAKAVNTAILQNKGNTIGLLSEKTLHSALKFYFCPDVSCHEIKFKGCVADVLINDVGYPHIFEIQTKQAWRLAKKLNAYQNDADVTVVLPLFRQKLIRWIDPQTGEVSEPHKSTRPKNIFSALREIYGIRQFICAPNVSVCILLMNGIEYKLLDGYGSNKKRRASKYDIIPEEILEEIWISEEADLCVFKLKELSDKEFTAREFAKAASLRLEEARWAMLALKALGLIEECGKRGRLKLWRYLY